MNTIEDIFLELGGTGKVARAIGVKHSAASEMRRRGSIPVKYWPSLIANAGDVQIDNNKLVKLHVDQTERAA